MTYEICKELIRIKDFDENSKADLLSKLDVFLLNDRFSEGKYNELVKLLNEKPIVNK